MSAEDSLRDALRQNGIGYDGCIVFDGEIHRFKVEGDHQKNCWYVGHPGLPVVGAFGCWKRGLSVTKWCERNSGSLTKSERQSVRRRQQAISAKLLAEIAARQAQARKRAAQIHKDCQAALSLHPYLVGKQGKTFGEVLEYFGDVPEFYEAPPCKYHGRLVLPLRDLHGLLHNLQFIDEGGTKRFLSGGRVKGCFFILAAKTDALLVIAEGYSTGATIAQATGHAVICAMNAGNLLEVARTIRARYPEREIIIAADNDQFTDGNPGLTKATEAAKEIRARLAVPQFDDPMENNSSDFNDLGKAQGLDQVRQQIDSAQTPNEQKSETTLPAQQESPDTHTRESDEETFQRLAAMAPIEYDRVRDAEAKKLGGRVTTLDSAVQARRPSNATDNLQGSVVSFDEVEPWREPVDGTEVLDEVSKCFGQYIVQLKEAADTQALWCLHAHLFFIFQCSPNLNIRSPEKGCGKSTDLDVVTLFTPRPQLNEDITGAALFRVVEQFKPTILIDECDTAFKEDRELIKLCNASHRRSGAVIRCEGEKHELRKFQVFCPLVLGGIGELPGTLHDRSIPIQLQRAKKGEIGKRFDSRHTEPEKLLCRKLARWALDHAAEVEALDPELPDNAFNRLADNWRPLFAIAKVIGGNWPTRCTAAFTKLTSSADIDAQGVGTMLLVDIAVQFAAKDRDKLPSLKEACAAIEAHWARPEAGEAADRLPSAVLAARLAEIEGRPWAEWGKHRKPISTNQLANQLRRFGVSPKRIRVGDETPRGYLLEDFKEAFARYLPVQPSPDPIPPLSDRHTATILGKTPISGVPQEDGMWHPEKTPFTRECGTVAPQKGGVPGLGDKESSRKIESDLPDGPENEAPPGPSAGPQPGEEPPLERLNI